MGNKPPKRLTYSELISKSYEIEQMILNLRKKSKEIRYIDSEFQNDLNLFFNDVSILVDEIVNSRKSGN